MAGQADLAGGPGCITEVMGAADQFGRKRTRKKDKIL
jgi:hypothetical protein